tara:strand:- start:1727 stop:2164 length:438 start_codon:yes stop_codon:yes gene_type:complete
MASLGQFHYFKTLSPSLDTAFGYPILQAPSDKALKLTSLAAVNGTNTANSEIIFYIAPYQTPTLADGSFDMTLNDFFFPIGLVSLSTGAMTGVSPMVMVGIPAKGAFTEIILPPGSMLIAAAGSVNFNGTIQYSAIGYDCAVDGY